MRKLLAIVGVISLLASVLVATNNIQTVSARDLPANAAETGSKTNNCGGSNEVKLAFPDYGTGTGKATGEYNSQQPSPEAHQDQNRGWAATAGECGSGTPGGPNQ
jgi:hypothetical protein